MNAIKGAGATMVVSADAIGLPVPRWTDARVDRLCALLGEGETFERIGVALGTTRNSVAGQVFRLRVVGDPRLPDPAAPKTVIRARLAKPGDQKKGKLHGGTLRRFQSNEAHGSRFRFPDTHPALVEGRTIFPTRVFPATEVPRLLVEGKNSRKIGNVVMKGRWRGFPIFTLTLEERATCPRSCLEWRSCYGSNMQFARRVAHGPALEARLWSELEEKQRRHPGGFLVRPHVLGDFYSVDYAELWAEALETFPALHVFGYTAHNPFSAIGNVVRELLGVHPDRFCFRFSGLNNERNGSVVIERGAATEHVVCPAQTGKTDCCATCALCWHSDRTIAFWRH